LIFIVNVFLVYYQCDSLRRSFPVGVCCGNEVGDDAARKVFSLECRILTQKFGNTGRVVDGAKQRTDHENCSTQETNAKYVINGAKRREDHGNGSV
jgi:hypothetical protein